MRYWTRSRATALPNCRCPRRRSASGRRSGAAAPRSPDQARAGEAMANDAARTVRVIAFPGAPNLPTFAAIEQGFFRDEGVAVEISVTPNSVFQAQKIAAGEVDVAFTAFDNVVAYSEGQGAPEGGNPDYCVIAGATQLELSFVV